MSGYQRINFKDQVVERPKTYDVTNNPDGSITLIDSFGNVEELGTPINSETMGHIEDALEEHDDRITVLEDASYYDNFLTKSQITNCITEIPQRIKLELNNGTLTLKAGSIVTIPNGFEEDGTTPKFDYVTIENDLSGGTMETEYYVYSYNPYNGIFGASSQSICFSGSTQPSNPTHNTFWYDTTANLLKRWGDNVWTGGYCLPFCQASSSMISQIFNGMGYIGTHFWLDKDVKMLLADGRNKDGTLKNKEIVINNVLVGHSYPTSVSGYRYKAYYLKSNSINGVATSKALYGLKKDIPTNSVPGHRWYFATDENKWYQCVQNTTNWYEDTLIILNSYKWDKDSQLVSEYKQEKYTFKALDYNDKSEVSSWAMSSDKYIDLTLGASGSNYTAPANGWVAISKKNNAATQYVSLGIGNSIRWMGANPLSGGSCSTSLPVRKGQTFYCTYTAGGALDFFRFIYAQGEVQICI